MEVSLDDFNSMLRQADSVIELGTGLYTAVVPDEARGIVCAFGKETLGTCLVSRYKFRTGIYKLFDCLYSVGSIIDFSISGVPAETFNELLLLTGRAFTDEFSEDQDRELFKDADTFEPIEFRTLQEIATQAARQCTHPRIVKRQSLVDDTIQESVTAEPALVFGGLNSLITYINGSPIVKKGEPIHFYNLTGQRGAEQNLNIDGFQCRISTPDSHIFILSQQMYIQTPYQTLADIPDSQFKRSLERLFWTMVSMNSGFGKIQSTTRTIYIQNRLQVLMRYTMIDRSYLEINNTQPFIQQIANGFRSTSIDSQDQEPVDHMKQWKFILNALQCIHKVYFTPTGLRRDVE